MSAWSSYTKSIADLLLLHVWSILKYLFENSQVKELLKLFVAIVDAELLKTIGLKIF